MLSAVSTRMGGVKDVYKRQALDGRNPDEYGMMGPVTLTPYRVTEIALQDKQILNLSLIHIYRHPLPPGFPERSPGR